MAEVTQEAEEDVPPAELPLKSRPPATASHPQACLALFMEVMKYLQSSCHTATPPPTPAATTTATAIQ